MRMMKVTSTRTMTVRLFTHCQQTILIDLTADEEEKNKEAEKKAKGSAMEGVEEVKPKIKVKTEPPAVLIYVIYCRSLVALKVATPKAKSPAKAPIKKEPVNRKRKAEAEGASKYMQYLSVLY